MASQQSISKATLRLFTTSQEISLVCAFVNINHSFSLGKRFEEEVLKSEENVIIEFFKPTCPSCAVLSVSYEEFAKIVSHLQESMTPERGSDNRLEYNLVNKYKIQNPHKFKNLRVYRYNIYNEVSEAKFNLFILV